MTPRPLARAAAYAVLIACSVLFLAPVAWMVLQSFKSQIDVIAQPPRFLFAPTLDNYAAVLGAGGFVRAFATSLGVACGAVAAGMLLGVPFAYVLARYRIAGREEIADFILSTRMLPAIVVIIPFVQIYNALGLIDTLIGVVIAHILLVIAIIVWVMRSFFAALPRELEEAAFLDGASSWRAFRSIMVPMAAPGLVTVAVLGFIFSWNDFFFAFTLTSFNAKTLPVYMATEFVGFLAVDWGKLSAAGLLATLPIVVLVLAAQKHLVKGLSLGAIK
ncbi:carbohydrate ABC transporter permease [Labrys wisconsinensis]|uniref:Multiple sugar transport system permease protein n=1 Tax=Labrys wisconsinensis TaxID=425677 RepID=A0ABU0J6J2_9HYPH|nr:carbohydrate ABC transporter permease [Labrys wisconsinensis]MDQ0469864.1 multiple sugar transport system permease protein [Labrys wisconsinensis]